MVGLRQRWAIIGCVAAAGILLGAGVGTDTRPKLIPADTVDVVALLPEPAAADSAEVRTEMKTVRKVQDGSTEAERARARSEMKLSMGAFTSVVGEWFTAENLPKTDALLKQLESDSKFFTTPAKNHFKRVRPCDSDDRIADITGENDKEFSYPSGHSTRGTIYATVLAELMPELKEKLLRRGQEIGWDRIIAGVHFPSDIVAGRILGQVLARGALANPAMKQELDGVRAELAAAKAKAGAAAPAMAH